MSRRRHPAGAVTVRRPGAEPEIVPASEFRRDAVSARAGIDPPRLLRVGGGYTAIPALALRDEREAVSEEAQDDLTRQVHDHEKAIRRAAVTAHAAHADRLLTDLREWRDALHANDLLDYSTRRDLASARRSLERLAASFKNRSA